MSGSWVKDGGSVWHADPYLTHGIQKVDLTRTVFVSIARCGRVLFYGRPPWGETMQWTPGKVYVDRFKQPICSVCEVLD